MWQLISLLLQDLHWIFVPYMFCLILTTGLSIPWGFLSPVDITPVTWRLGKKTWGGFWLLLRLTLTDSLHSPTRGSAEVWAYTTARRPLQGILSIYRGRHPFPCTLIRNDLPCVELRGSNKGFTKRWHSVCLCYFILSFLVCALPLSLVLPVVQLLPICLGPACLLFV